MEQPLEGVAPGESSNVYRLEPGLKNSVVQTWENYGTLWVLRQLSVRKGLICLNGSVLDIFDEAGLMGSKPVDMLMSMYYDNQAVIHIASNLVFYERTKYIEVDWHLI